MHRPRRVPEGRVLHGLSTSIVPLFVGEQVSNQDSTVCADETMGELALMTTLRIPRKVQITPSCVARADATPTRLLTHSAGAPVLAQRAK